MNTVIIVNLNGKAYKLEEAGAEALRAYLDQAPAARTSTPTSSSKAFARNTQNMPKKATGTTSPKRNCTRQSAEAGSTSVTRRTGSA